ncbi:FAD/NAD(P)-binding domain-containing protein [Eremomyces bilateralis CBS 781.70]|uniref:FAD/NAD(P)-binding domain-containing protein n=1 Tax=Eremomyces bilateralis CBS 781.70 TaxID=1392243 RepID=A0A6G1GE83_9PEZI|nr:FAD/NAD(P)-binding domain-containing protein [Eremomyces bilateralis CBS 781.70]KAF1816415.1 FAD/NAD(P)-binding domain-containing protein [Eremomyces bilateralis CBS 781.70]
MTAAPDPAPLKVLIVGGGIGGLTAATALRQEGHEVTVFERSKLDNEAGAAIHLGSNCNGLLRRLGLFAEDIGGNPTLGIVQYTAAGNLTFNLDLRKPNLLWKHSWLLVHRAHLHKALYRFAADPAGKGNPAEMKISSCVASVNAEVSTITLENGDVFKGDVVIGADGVHSITRKQVSKTAKPFGSGRSAFRFLIPKEEILADPETRDAVDGDGRMVMWMGNDRRLVMYPCSNNTLLNFVAIHPSKESDMPGDGWSTGGNKARLLEAYKEFCPIVRALLSKVNAETLSVWTLLDMDVLRSWTVGKLALMGDAAHPFLPHQGQGGGMAIEDAVSLGVLLGKGTRKEEVKERLRLYEVCRMERAHRIQEYTRLSGRDLEEAKKDGKELNMMEYQSYCFGHDEYDHTIQMLRKSNWTKTPDRFWRMPVAFGSMPGPRQDSFGLPHDGLQSTFVTASIKFRTSRTLLQNFFPSPAFSFSSPGTVATASIRMTTLGNMSWLGGGGYNFSGLFVHGVQYTKRDASVLRGSYCVVVFEDLADAILSGREELGMSKLGASIQVHQKEGEYAAGIDWRGVQFARMRLEGLHLPNSTSSMSAADKAPAMNDKLGEAEEGTFCYRYIPAVGRPGTADAEYAVFIPSEGASQTPNVIRTMLARKGDLAFEARDRQALPTLHHITARLAEIPVYEVVEARIDEGTGVEDLSQAFRIE